MTEDHLVMLISRLISGELSPEEIQELEQWANAAAVNRQLLERVSAEGFLEKEISAMRRIDPVLGFERWLHDRRRRGRSKLLWLSGLSAAAVVCGILVTGSLLKWRAGTRTAKPVEVVKVKPIQPGKNTAVLVLGNGRELLLDSVARGELGLQGNSKVVKVGKGSLAYQGGGESRGDIVYNILRTPRSGQYQLQLPDGTRVWLNNETSLKYPTSFRGMARSVELSGEAFFEVAPRADQPFVVKLRDEDVQVLGTSFNIMSYSDEGGTQTTLLTGAIAVRTGAALVKLKPDEQAQVGKDGGVTVLKDVASGDIVSWKEGFFYFGKSSFAAVMRQLARWYDIEVVYAGKVPEMEFGGKIDRTLPLNDLLPILRKYWDNNQVNFRLEGRTLIVASN